MRESLIKLQLERELISNEFIDNLEDILFGNLVKGETFEQKDCVICFDEFNPSDFVTKIPTCSHVFHKNCAHTWFKSKAQAVE